MGLDGNPAFRRAVDHAVICGDKHRRVGGQDLPQSRNEGVGPAKRLDPLTAAGTRAVPDPVELRPVDVGERPASTACCRVERAYPLRDVLRRQVPSATKDCPGQA